ncbi:alpha/beta fold hydrolase [Actinoplanes sp. CA-030573]|uniref:alpha/beta fold hydrolase n=1 Tax=Actinoplanes sp. CA-030573 TaxID=3239898 RepID=UPI003D92FB85
MHQEDFVETLTQWQAGGRKVRVALAGGRTPAQVFVRVRGDGPAVTLLHGFPTSSWDWARTEPLLARDYTVISLDLPGYGASDKPRGHRYHTAEHADVLLQVWSHLGIDDTAVVGHDVGTSVARELLARAAEGTVPVSLRGMVLMNGSLIQDHYTPARITRLLANPLLGPVLARGMTEQRFIASLRPLFSDAGRPSDNELRAHWTALTSDAGTARLPQLVHYIADGVANRERWRAALASTPVPLSVVWGALDPAIGIAVLDDVRDLLPGIPLTVLDDVGHFPQIERPIAVVAAVRTLPATTS